MTYELEVRKVRQEALRIKSFEFCLRDGGRLPDYAPGSNLTVTLPTGISRTYSLIDAGSRPEAFRIAVLYREPSAGGARYMHEKVRVGDVLKAGAPASTFRISPGADNHLLIAGGIGITPILSMARHLHSRGGRFHLHYCARNRREAAFLDDLRGSGFSDQVTFYFSEQGERIDLDTLVRGYTPGTAVYCCGPAGLMDAVVAKCAHWPDGTVHLDSFEPLRPKEREEAFRVRLAGSGQEFQVRPDQSILNALREHGIRLSSVCEQGVCGSCLTPVIEGVPDHRDRILTDEERASNDLIAVCCSRSSSDLLVLDL
nr:PDR/VanB family oxidoreductase [Mesorhizobium sp. WSM4875]